MNKILAGTFSVGLLFAAASCGSSSSSTSASTATTAGSAATTAAGGATLTDTQAKVVALTMTKAAEAEIVLDEPCVAKLVAQLSDADAKLLVASAGGASPTLSAAGEALGQQLVSCAPAAADATTTPTT